MFDPSLMILIIAMVIGVMAGVLSWLVYTHLKLKRDYRILADIVYGHNNDIADLCAATLAVDGHMDATDEQLSALYAKFSDYPSHETSHETSSHPYSSVIQKVRGGASVNELMQDAGLSQDEAALLIRLHGSKT